MFATKHMVWFIVVSLITLTVQWSTLYIDKSTEITHDTTNYKYVYKAKIQSRLSTADRIIQVINLTNSKYNYTKLNNNIDNNMVIPIQVPKQYQQSISYIHKNSTGHYQLDDNISFVIHNTLDFGWYSFVYNVSIIINNTVSHNVALKYLNNINSSFGNRGPISVYKTEYNLLTKIEKYIKYYNVNSINIPLLLASIPLYFTPSHHCFLFVQQVPNAMTWTDAFMFNAESILPLIIQNKGNIFAFLIDCFEDIMNIFQILWQLDIFFNDFHGKNLLIDTKTFHCYLVDFNYLFTKQDLLRNSNSLRCFPSTCSPVHWYYVKDRKGIVRKYLRKKLRKQMINILSKFAIYSKQYEIAVRIFHTFVRLYYLQIHKENDILFKMNEQIIANWSSPGAELGEHDIEGNKPFIWCKRYELYIMIRSKIINENLLSDMTTENDTKQRFLDIISIVDDDLLFLNPANCSFILH